MRYLTILLAMCFCATMCCADVYIVTDKATDEVISVSNENDCVVTDKMKLIVDQSIELEDLTLINHPSMYIYKDGKFKANIPKLMDREKIEVEEYERKAEKRKIDARMLKLAMDSLKTEGKEFKYDHGEE